MTDMQELVVMTRGQLESVIENAVMRGVERVRPLLLRAAHEYVTLQEAVTIYPFTKQQLNRLRKTGEGPACYVMGRTVTYKVSDLEDWFQKFRINQLY